MRKSDVLEAHGIRLRPASWRKIERIAQREEVDRTTWLREQIESLLARVPEVHEKHENGSDPQSRLEYEAIRNGLMEVERQKEEAK